MPESNLPSFEDAVNGAPRPSTSTIGVPVGNTGYGTSKYDKPVNYQDALYSLNDFRYKNQGNLDILANATTHLVGTAIQAGLEIPAILYGTLKAPYTEWKDIATGNFGAKTLTKVINNIYDNEISRNIVDPMNNWFQNTFQVYQSEKQSKAAFFSLENLASGHTLDMLASGAGYTIGSMLTGMALTKVFGLAKAAALGEKLVGEKDLMEAGSKMAKLAMPLDVQKQLVIGTTMAGMEASQQSRSDKDENIKRLKDEHPELTDEQIKSIADQMSVYDFAFNMAILGPMDVLLVRNWWRPDAKSFLSSAEVNIPKDLGEISLKEAPKGFAKVLNTTKNVLVNRLTKGFVIEGGQEGFQFAAQKAIEDYTDRRIQNPDGNSSLDALYSIGTGLYDMLATKEGAENWFTGGVIGMFGGIPANIQELNNINRNKDFAKKQVEWFNKNIPVQNKILADKMLDANRAFNYANNADEHLKNRNVFDYYNEKHSAFVSLIQQHIDNGTLELLQARIKSLYGAKSEDINNFFGNQVTKEGIDNWDPHKTLGNIELEINKIVKTDLQIKRLIPNPYDPKKEPDKYRNFRQLQKTFTYVASTIDNVNSRITKLNAELIELGAFPLDLNTYINLSTEEKEKITKELMDYNEANLNPKDLEEANKIYNDLMSLKERHEIFKQAYKELQEESTKKKVIEKAEIQNSPKVENIETNEKKPPIPQSEFKPEQKTEVNSSVNTGNIQKNNNFNINLKKQGSDQIIKVKNTDNQDEFVDENGNVYNLKTNPEYYIQGQTNISKGIKQELSPEHFIRLHKTRLSDDKLSVLLNPSMGSTPSILFDNKLQEVLKSKDGKNRISFIVSKGSIGEIESERPDKTTKLQSGEINIVLQLDNGEKNFQIQNPDLYTINGKTVAFKKLKEWGDKVPDNIVLIDNLNEFNKYFSNYKQKEFTEDEFIKFQDSWENLKEFNDAVIRYYAEFGKGQELPIPQGIIESKLTGQLAPTKARDEKGNLVMTKITEYPQLTNTPIYDKYNNNINNAPVLDTDPSISKLDWAQSSYYVLARMDNGFSRVIRIYPAAAKSLEVIPNIKEVAKKLKQISPEETSTKKIQSVLDELNFFIAADPQKFWVTITNADLLSENLLEIWVTNNELKNEAKQGNKVKSSVKIVFNSNDLENLNMDSLIRKINTEGQIIGFSVTENSFKQNLKNKEKITSSDFEVQQLDPEIFKNWSLEFDFNTSKLNELISQKEIKKEEKKVLQEIKSQDTLEAKKADIERRRQEELNSIRQGRDDSWMYDEVLTKEQTGELVSTKKWRKLNTKEEGVSKINAKYDAELAALKIVAPESKESEVKPKLEELLKDGNKIKGDNGNELTVKHIQEGHTKKIHLIDSNGTIKLNIPLRSDGTMSDYVRKSLKYLEDTNVHQKSESGIVSKEETELDKISKDLSPEDKIALNKYLESYPEERKIEKAKAWIKRNSAQGQIDDLYKAKIVLTQNQLDPNPLSFDELRERLYKQVPQTLGFKRVENLINTLQADGILVSAFFDNAIYVGDHTGKKDLDHEAFHGIFGTVLSPKEQERYLNAKRKELTQDKINNQIYKILKARPYLSYLSEQELENLAIEEFLSDDYADFRENKLQNPKIWKGLVFDLIDRFIKWVKSLFKTDIQGLFERIDKGAFVNSNVNLNTKNNLIPVKTKLLAGKGSEESRNIIATFASLVINSSRKTGVKKNIDEVLQESIEFFNPNSDANKELIKKSETPKELENYLEEEFDFLSTPKIQETIKNEVNKYIKYLNYNPKKDKIENDQSDDENPSREFDLALSEFNPDLNVSVQIKSWIASTTYEVNMFGKEIKRAVHFTKVFNSMLKHLTNVSGKNEIIPVLAQEAKYDIELAAVYNRLVKETGYSKDTPDGNSLRSQLFLNLFKNSFHLARLPFSSAYAERGELKVKTTNKNDAGKYTFYSWSNNFISEAGVKLLSDAKFKSKIQNDLNTIIQLMASRKKGDPIISNLAEKTLSRLGIKLVPEYAKLVFDVKENEEEEAERQEILGRMENNAITRKDIMQLNDIILRYTTEGGINPFTHDRFSARLRAIAEGSSARDSSFINPSFRTSDNKQRYTFVPYNQILQTTEDIKDDFSSKNKIIKNLKKNPYLSYNILVNGDMDQVIESIENLEVALIGDNELPTSQSRDQLGKSYIDSTEGQFLGVMHSFFENSFKPTGQSLEYYRGIPFIISDKRSLYSLSMLKKHYADMEGDKIKYTDIAKKHLRDIFTQEFRTLRGDFNIPLKNNLWIYLPVFNFEKELLNKIQDIEDIDKLFESDILPKIQSMIEADINLYKSSLSKDSEISKYIKKDDLDLTNFYLNNFINNIAASQLYLGDAHQIKAKEGETLPETLNSFAAEFTKRNSSINAAGWDQGEGNDVIKFTDDSVGFLNKYGKSGIDKEEYDKLSEEEKQDYYENKTDIDDSQGGIMIHALIKDKINSGKSTPEEIETLRKIDGDVFDEKGNPVYPSPEELYNSDGSLKIDLIPLKHVITGNLTTGERIYIKTSLMIYDPWTLGIWVPAKQGEDKGHWEPRLGREQGFYRWLEGKRGQVQKDGSIIYPDIFAPKSASKVFFGEHSKWSEYQTGNVKNTKLYFSPRINRREQVIKSSSESPTIKLMSQVQQAVNTVLPNTQKARSLNYMYMDGQVQYRHQMMGFLLSQIANPDGTPKENQEWFWDKIRAVVEDSTPEINIIEFLQTFNGKSKYSPGNLGHTYQKVEDLLTSYFKPAFQINFPGGKNTQISSRDFKVVRNKENGQIIPSDVYEKNKKKYPNVEVGYLRHGERIISDFTARKLGLNYGDSVISSRIPTQELSFISEDKIYDKLNPWFGDSTVGSPDEVLYSGTDYDDDTRYYITKQRNPQTGVYYGEEVDLDQKWNSYKIWWIENNSMIKKELYNQLKTNPYYLEVLNPLKEFLTQKKFLKNELLSDEDNPYQWLFKITNRQLKEEIREYAEEVKIIREEIEQEILSKFGLISTREEYIQQNQPMSPGGELNRIFDAMKGMLEIPEVQKYIKSPTDTETLPNTVKEIEKIKGTKSYIIPFTPYGLSKLREDNIAGAKLRSAAVNTQQLSGALTKYKINLRPNFHIKFNGKTLNTFNTTPEETFLKSKDLSGKVHATVDNSKNPVAGKLNWTMQNLGLYGILDALGVRAHLGSTWLAVQPAIVEANPLWKTGLLLDSYINKFQSLIEKAKGKKLSIKEIDSLNDILNNYEKNGNTTEDLKWALAYSVDPNEKSIQDEARYLSIQIESLKMLGTLSSIYSYAFNWSKIMGSNTGRFNASGSSKSLEALESRVQAYNQLFNPPKPEETPFDPSNLLQDTHLIENIDNIQKILNISKWMFIYRTAPFNKIYVKLLDSLDLFGKTKVRTKVAKSLLSYIQMRVLRQLNPNTDFTSFVLGDDNMVNRFLELKKKGLQENASDDFKSFINNPFIQYLQGIKPWAGNNKTGLNLLVTDSNTKFDKESSELMIDSIIALQYSNNDEISKFGRDLFNYAASIWNLQFINNSFTNKLPASSFKQMSDALNLINSEFSKENPDEQLIQRLTGRNIKQMQDEFIENFKKNGFNTNDFRALNLKETSKLNKITKQTQLIWNKIEMDDKIEFSLSPEVKNYKELLGSRLFTPVQNENNEMSFVYPELVKIQTGYDIINDVPTYELFEKEFSEGTKVIYTKVKQFYNNGMHPWLYTPEENFNIYDRIEKSKPVYETSETNSSYDELEALRAAAKDQYIDDDLLNEEYEGFPSNPNDLGLDASEFEGIPGTLPTLEELGLSQEDVKDLVNQQNLPNLQENRKQEIPQVTENQNPIVFQEHSTSDYTSRTKENANTDATIALAIDFTSAGEKLTYGSVYSQKKKYIPLNLSDTNQTVEHKSTNSPKLSIPTDNKGLEVTQERVDNIVNALNSVNATSINIAGNGIYTMKGKYTQTQIDQFTYNLLKAVITSPNLKNKIQFLRTGGQTGFDEAGAKAGVRLGINTSILAPHGWKFRNINGQDISNEQQFKDRFKNVVSDAQKLLNRANQIEQSGEKLNREKAIQSIQELAKSMNIEIDEDLTKLSDQDLLDRIKQICKGV